MDERHTLPSQNSNEYFIMLRNLSHMSSKLIVSILCQSIELLLVVDGDHSYFPFELELDC